MYGWHEVQRGETRLRGLRSVEADTRKSYEMAAKITLSVAAGTGGVTRYALLQVVLALLVEFGLVVRITGEEVAHGVARKPHGSTAKRG